MPLRKAPGPTQMADRYMNRHDMRIENCPHFGEDLLVVELAE